MNPLTLEWISKAEGDFAVAQRESRVRRKPNYDAVCFHVQQCVEKYLKAILHRNEIRFGKTHNLVLLLDRAIGVAPLFEPYRETLRELTQYVVIVRYPGDSVPKETAREALKHCKAVRSVARAARGLAEEDRGNS